MNDELLHYGIKRRSGRYPFGSGKDPQRSFDFISEVEVLRKQGMTSNQIAEHMGLSTTEYRKQITIANDYRKKAILDSVISRHERGESNVAIAAAEGITEGTVRNYIKNKDKVAKDQLTNITEALKEELIENGYLDVGPGVEIAMGISRSKLDAALVKLQDEGMTLHNVYSKRLQNKGKSLTVTVLSHDPDINSVLENSSNIKAPGFWTEDGGLTKQTLGPLKNVDWDRIAINYAETGGEDKDGVIELRRGVNDLDLGTKRYAQVRIAVGGTHYLKGMAMYADDLPDGVDIRFNTNKAQGTPPQDVLKGLKPNKFNPFGATIQKQKGALNIVNEEGDWNTWSSRLSSQFLSKQPLSLVRERIGATFDELTAEYALLNSLTNPVVRKHMLKAYAEGLDAKAKHLKAKGLPKTKNHVILPFPDMNPNEVYAPGYSDGERVVLIRHPHGGRFEIPELIVNNKGPARKTLGNAVDAIGIHPSMARKLSGADFDGDTVMVIPNNDRKIKSRRALEGLKNFDAVAKYQVDADSPAIIRKRNPKTGMMESTGLTISPEHKQKQMGIVSNLITDMTIKGASDSELARAVRHSMVVIDSEKHRLDHKQSAIDNGISALQKRYQTHINPITGKEGKGASTIVSQSKTVVKNVGGTKVDVKDPVTGKTKSVIRGGKDVDLIDYVSDVTKLSSGTAVEGVYTDYIKKVKALNNTATKTYQSIKPPKRDPIAAKTYSKEVSSLDAKLTLALSNAPKERRAQLLATDTYHKTLKEMDYNMDKDQKKKLKTQAVADARARTNAKRTVIDITDKEWEAIQNNAISPSKLSSILMNADAEKVQKLATPRQSSGLSVSNLTRANNLLNRGYTYAEVAEAIGTSVSTLHAELRSNDIDDD